MAPKTGLKVLDPAEWSGVFVLPITMPPALGAWVFVCVCVCVCVYVCGLREREEREKADAIVTTGLDSEHNWVGMGSNTPK